jgi:hypothetical protein
MSTFRGDASEVYKLAADLSQVGARSVPALRGVMGELGDAFAREWADNARETAGEHGKHYPDSIGSELAFSVTGIDVNVGPDKSKPQGGMGPGFEFGSRNQPPHLDGLRALDGMQVRAERVIESTVGFLFG